MIEENQDGESLVVKVQKGIDPISEEGVNTICSILNNIPDLEATFQGPGYMTPYASGKIGNYTFQIRPEMGIIISFNDQSPDELDHYHRYSSIEGAVGWILCQSGYGNNTSWYESFSAFLEPEGEFKGLVSSMESKPSPEAKRRYERILSSIKETITSPSNKDPFSMGPKEGSFGNERYPFSLGEDNGEDGSEDD